jgi:hypothetical protein
MQMELEIAYTVFCIGMTAITTILGIMHGGHQPKDKLAVFIDALSLEAWLLASPVLSLVLLFPQNWPLIGFVVSCYLAMVLYIRKGHGQYMALPYSVKRLNAEGVDVFVKPFFGRDPRDATKLSKYISHDELLARIEKYGKFKLRVRNWFGLTVLAAVGHIPVGVFLMTQGYMLPGLILCGTILKDALAYQLGHMFFRKGTFGGELFRGIFFGLTYSYVGYLLWVK